MRRSLGLFIGVLTGSLLWLLWLSIAGGLLTTPMLALRQALPGLAGIAVGGLVLALVMLPPALLLARLGSHMAVRMAMTPEVRRPAFLLVLVLDAFLIVLMALAIGAGGAGVA